MTIFQYAKSGLGSVITRNGAGSQIMKPEELDEIEARAEAATRGPWVTNSLDWVDKKGVKHQSYFYYDAAGSQVFEDAYEVAGPHNLGNHECGGMRLLDADFIAAARTDIPKLITHVRELRKRLEDAESDKRAWRIADRLAHLCGDYMTGDGFFILRFAEFASHGEDDEYEPCDMEHSYDDDDNASDPKPWSCHFHIGLMGEGEYPAGWDHGKRFCARGETAEEAILKAAAKADPAALSPSTPEPGSAPQRMPEERKD